MEEPIKRIPVDSLGILVTFAYKDVKAQEAVDKATADPIGSLLNLVGVKR